VRSACPIMLSRCEPLGMTDGLTEIAVSHSLNAIQIGCFLLALCSCLASFLRDELDVVLVRFSFYSTQGGSCSSSDFP